MVKLTSIAEIQQAVLDGHTVHWKNIGYTVITDSKNQWFVKCGQSLTGLTYADGTFPFTPTDFFIGG
jgi:hypothetical protein